MEKKIQTDFKKEKVKNVDETVSLIPHQDDEELKPGKKFGIYSQANKRTLIIHKCVYEDQGQYICRTTDDNTSAKLTVHGKDERLLSGTFNQY